MTSTQINALVQWLQPCTVVETHISWVLLTTSFAYKVKKPVVFSFVNTINLDTRKLYCEKEIALNMRLTDDVYIGVVPILLNNSFVTVGPGEGTIIDYSVKMHRLPSNMRMDILLDKDKVTEFDISALARKIATFHVKAEIVYVRNLSHLQTDFNDILSYSADIKNLMGLSYTDRLNNNIRLSDCFFKSILPHMAKRVAEGFYRDCHGDLHTGNIFLLPTPEPFDCIEFNDSFRYIDVLNEIAFICMDLDAHGKEDFSVGFLNTYQKILPIILYDKDEQLFSYYKAYRANIRAKISLLSAAQYSNHPQQKQERLQQAANYFNLMEKYIAKLY